MSQRHMCVLHTMHVKISSASLHDSFVLFHHNNIACVRRSARRKKRASPCRGGMVYVYLFGFGIRSGMRENEW